jgi:molecular chaperone GrpE (heat shock protein)
VLKIRFEGVTPPASASSSATPGVGSTPGASPPATSEDQFFPVLPNWAIFAIGGLALVAILGSIFKNPFRTKSKKAKDARPPQHDHTKDTPPPYYDLDDIKSDLKVLKPEPRRGLLGWIRWPWGSREKPRTPEENTWTGVDESQQPTKPTPPAANEAPKSDIDAKPSTRPTGAAPPQPETKRPQDGSPPASSGTRSLDPTTKAQLADLQESQVKLQQAHASFAELVKDVQVAEKTLRNDVDEKVNALREELKNNLKEESTILLGVLGKQQDQLNKVEQSLDNAHKYMQSQVEHFQKTVARLLAEAERKETEQHSRYSKILGEVLGFNVETLRQGEFDAIVKEAGVRLNHYLSEQRAKVDGLSDLHRKAQAINGEIQTTLEKVRQLKPELGKLDQYGERAKRLANDLKNVSSLQGQPQNLTVTLDLPVGKSTDGRAMFLENLGKAIKDQIDRLDDPHAFWSKELEVFATSDIVALADICDVEVMGGRPGSKPELERSLYELFRQAGLEDIVPTLGGPFEPGEQHLIDMVPGSPTNSQTISRVVKRGFYYTGNAKKQLIRKAGVNVYR